MAVEGRTTMGPHGWAYGHKKKRTRQGEGRHTKYGSGAGSIIKYRGQGGGKKSHKRQ